MKQTNLHNLAAGLSLLAATALTGCFTEPDEGGKGGGDTTATYFTLGLTAAGMNYFLTVDSLLTGTVSPVGNGMEVPGSGDNALQSGKYIYDFTRASKNISQYELKTDGTIVKVADIAGGAYVADRAYSRSIIDDSTLLIIDPLVWGGATMKWVAISIPAFTVRASGSFSLPTTPIPGDTSDWRVNPGRTVVSGNKVYMGSVKWALAPAGSARGTINPAGSFVYALDYPSMTNPVEISTTKFNAELSGVSAVNTFKTENGDMYFMGTAGWFTGSGFSKPDSSTNFGVVLRIKAGQTEFDTSYVLDFSKALGEPTNAMQLQYVGDNKAIAVLFEEADISTSAALDGDVYSFAKVDLAAKTVVKYSVPKSGSRLSRRGAVSGTKYYTYLKSIAEGNTRILELDLEGGPDAYTLGATIQGANVTGYGLFAHPRN
jgi:hypothetical protein